MPNDSIQSHNFVPESEPGKGDGQGWRLNKDGTIEMSEDLIQNAMLRSSNFSSDAVQAFREKHLGKPFHRAVDRELLKNSVLGTVGEGDYTASIAVHELGKRSGRMEEIPTVSLGWKPGRVLEVGQPGGAVKIVNLEDGTQHEVFKDGKVRITSYSNETMAKVANATQSLEQLVSHHNRMIADVAAIAGEDVNLRALAGNHFRTGEALLRELLRKVDTRDVDDGK